MSPSPYRCEVLYIPDPGQPDQPAGNQKLYLVTGTGVVNGRPIQLGAYGSWNSGGSCIQGLKTATCKGYAWNERDAMRSAWFASCDRGEHQHPANPAPLSPSVALASTTSIRVSIPGSSHLTPRGRSTQDEAGFIDTLPPYLWTPSPAPARASPTPTSRRTAPGVASPSSKKEKVKIFHPPMSRTPSPNVPPHVHVSGERSYAVRSGAHGWVFSDLRAARDKYHNLQNRGLNVELATSAGFTQALTFAEESEASSDESESGRMTDDLAEELALREAHGDEWKEVRDRNAKGKGRHPCGA
ncbi:hypothetical protein DFH07DRAFT_778624 [Mycena maculata]|uniref:Uncharacterized protein n=1 Tax=Mycena maculata TaxID=230809 RepID=A0AAD7N159_9AGAR|nr:hypothetical protein DFH07DRAFT_778624 [Mycena maculata]